MNFDIVFENQNFVVVNKPSGVLSTPARFGEEDERECLGTALQKEMQIQIFPVHRLDFEVKGLVMYAKNASAHRAANAWFEKKQVFKTYRAYTSGPGFDHIPPNVANDRIILTPRTDQKYDWNSRILRGKRRAFQSPHGKDSQTLATYLGKTDQGYHSWDLNPVTGRSHQLRFELSHRGFPIIGDKLYGSSIQLAPDSVALQAYRIDFTGASSASSLGLPSELKIHPFSLQG